MDAPKGFIIAIKSYEPPKKRLRIVDLMTVRMGVSANAGYFRLNCLRTGNFVFVIPDKFEICRRLLAHGKEYKEKRGYSIDLKIYPLVSLESYCLFISDFFEIDNQTHRMIRDNLRQGYKYVKHFFRYKDHQMALYLLDTLDFLLTIKLRGDNENT